MSKPTGEIHPKSIYTLGVDIARMGKDSSVFTITEKPFDDDDLYVVFIGETTKELTTQTIGRIKFLDNKFNFKKICVDMTGLGAGVLDNLHESLSPHKVEGITFTQKSKIDIYSNLYRLLEKRANNQTGGLHLPRYKKLIQELVDLQIEFNSKGIATIHHLPNGYDDFTDSLALSVYYYKQIKPIGAGLFHIASR